MKARTIILTGLLAGTLDGIAAMISSYIKNGTEPAMVFKFIASGVFGRSAFSGGSQMVAAGTLFHYIIATIWAFLFFALYDKTSLKSKNQYLIGTLYGAFVWLAMNLVIVPLSNTPTVNQTALENLVGLGIIIVAVGLPICLICYRVNKDEIF